MSPKIEITNDWMGIIGEIRLAASSTCQPCGSSDACDVAEFFGALMPARVVIEVGTHSAWVQEIIAGCGHEVLGGQPAVNGGVEAA
jgi:hypothetical protein